MYKSKLQVLCQQRKWLLPEYNSTKHGLDHNPRFSATVTINGLAFDTVQLFRSSKEAQNDAAKLALDHLSDPQPRPSNPIPSPSSFPQPSLPASSGSIITAPPPTLGTAMNGTNDTNHTLQPNIQGTCQTSLVNGTESGASCQAFSSTSSVEVDSRSKGIQHMYKNQLQTYAQKRNLLLPVYSCEREGPPHDSRFKCNVTLDGQTYEGQEFLPTMKEAENAVAKSALMSLLPNGVQEEDSGLYKNLLQELIQKEGISVPTYSTKISGEVHRPTFVATVEIEGEPFTGQEAKSKKHAEMSAAKVAYHTLRERKSSQIPLVLSAARQGQGASEIVSSSFQSSLVGDLQQQARPNSPTILFPTTTTREQTKENSEIAEGSSHHTTTTVSSGPATCGTSGGFSSSDMVHGSAPDSNRSPSPVSQNGSSSTFPSDSAASLVMDSTLEPPAKRIMSSYNKVSVYPRKPNMTFPRDTIVLPMSDEKWVAFSHP